MVAADTITVETVCVIMLQSWIQPVLATRLFHLCNTPIKVDINPKAENSMRRFIIGLALTFLCADVLADHITPEEVVRETTDAVLSRLENERADLKDHPDRLQQLVRELIIPHFDFDTMSRLALGRYWKYLDDTQKTCFTSTFHNILVERYAYILLSYDQQKITYQPPRNLSRQGYLTVVQNIILKNGNVIPVEYPMRPLEDGWKVIDLVIDNISLVRSHRVAFQEEIRNKGLGIFLEENLDCDY